MKATQRFTEDECNHIYELYSYMVDVSFPHYTYSGPAAPPAAKIDHRRMENLAINAARVVADILRGYHLNPKRNTKAKVVPMKRRVAR